MTTFVDRAAEALAGRFPVGLDTPYKQNLAARIALSSLFTDREALTPIWENALCVRWPERRFCADDGTTPVDFMHPECVVAALASAVVGEK